MEFRFPSLSPPSAPSTEGEWLDWLRLLRSRRVGISTFYRLMAERGDAAEALKILPRIAEAAGDADYAICTEEAAADEWRRAMLCGAVPLAVGSANYPAVLTDLNDPPPLLWALGDPALLARRAVAVVGARNASSLGTRMARSIAQGLGREEIVTVSGLARGIDTAAHQAALDAGTIAVVAGGVDVTYPQENAVLTQEIGERGLILSEQPIGMQPLARHFPRRNRLIAALGEATVVVEAAAKSGSLLTAKMALDLGRDVMAVPGHPFDARASGCNLLIRDGAGLVRGPADVIDAIGPSDRPVPAAEAVLASRPERTRSLADTAALHGEILERLGPVPTPEDQIIRDLGRPAALVTAEIVSLELDGRLIRDPGGMLRTS